MFSIVLDKIPAYLETFDFKNSQDGIREVIEVSASADLPNAQEFASLSIALLNVMKDYGNIVIQDANAVSSYIRNLDAADNT